MVRIRLEPPQTHQSEMVGEFFYRIGNCVKNRTTSIEVLRDVRQFGRGNGYGPLIL